MSLTTNNCKELPMADKTIDTSQQTLNRLDQEITALKELTFEVQGVILMLQFLSRRLRENQEAFTKH